MAAITGTKAYLGELAATNRILQVTATVGSASDTITLTEATHGCSSIVGVIGWNIESGQGANFQTLHPTVSGLVITVASLNGAGTAATTFGNIRLTLLVA